MSETAGQLQSPINEHGVDSTPLLKKENGKALTEMARKKLQRLRGVVLAAGLTDLVSNAIFLALSICINYDYLSQWATDHQVHYYRWTESVFELFCVSFFRFIVCVVMFGRPVPHAAHVVFLSFEAICLIYLIAKTSLAGLENLFGPALMYLFSFFGMVFVLWEFVTIVYICRLERGYLLHGSHNLHAPRYYYSHPHYKGVQPYAYAPLPYYPPNNVYGPGIYQGGLTRVTSPLSPPVVMHYSYPLYNGLAPVPMNHASQQPIPVPAAPVARSSSSSPNSSYTSTKSNQETDTQTAAAATSQAVATSPTAVNPSINGSRPVPSYSQALTFPTLLPTPTHMQAVPHPPATPAPSNVIP